MRLLFLAIIFELITFPGLVVAPVLDKPYSPQVIEYNAEAPRDWAIQTGIVEENGLVDRIVFCESSWNEKACHNDYECKKGLGLVQFISSTWNETLVRMSKDGAYLPERCWQFVYHPISEEKREIIFDGECNLLAGIWLISQDGDIHWRKYSGKCYLVNNI